MKTVAANLFQPVAGLLDFTPSYHVAEWASLPLDVRQRLMVLAVMDQRPFDPVGSALVAYATSQTGMASPDIVAGVVLSDEIGLRRLTTFAGHRHQHATLRQQLLSRILTVSRLPVTSRLYVAASDSIALAELRHRNFVSVTAVF